MDNDPKMANKPAQVKEKIAQGKMAAFYKEICLLHLEREVRKAVKERALEKIKLFGSDGKAE